MQLKIVKMDKFFIAGLYGHIKKQTELQNRLNEQYANTPFQKKSKYQVQIYFWGNKDPDKQAFYGFEVDPSEDSEALTILELPACEWAVFEVNTAEWWDTGDKEVEGWIKDNPNYHWRKFDGSVYQLEYWKEKFNGIHPDSVSEVWYPLE
ncbi:MAG: GyrI-like domain-containing protein [Defluviitaleaceae bacterium]|nr:GyrI-like domain-containing protein [Defluviitaleaceae bacterium]